MIWYCDTETIQVKKSNYHKIDFGQYKDYVNKRLEMSKVFFDKKMKDDESDDTLLVLNIFNAGINEKNEVVTSKNITNFFDRIANLTRKNGEKTAKVYYHNLKFDMTNILDFFKANNVDFFEKNSLIVNTKWYMYSFFYRGIFFTFLDSYNLVMCSLKDFGETFDLPKDLWKSDFDFDFNNIDEINKMIRGDTKLEKYGVQDVRCLKAGVEVFKKYAGVDKMTLASSAFESWSQMRGEPLPKLTNEEQIDANYTYTGAICYANPLYQGQILEDNFTYIDNNGLYSASSYSKAAGFEHYFPISKGVKKFDTPDFWDVTKYQTIRCYINATALSTTTIPFFRLGKQSALGCNLSRRYKQNEYLKHFKETVYINSIDLRLLHKYYKVNQIVFDYYWEYETEKGIFDKYIDIWSAEKQKGKENDNMGLYSVAKFMLNALTGKFGQLIDGVEVKVDFKEDVKVLEHRRELTDKDIQFIYMPIVSAILAYSREIFMEMTNSYPKDKFVYCDTDSNILFTDAYNKYIDKGKIHKTKLGYWDIEHEITKLKVLRQKTYMFTNTDGDLICKCAGATKEIKKFLTFDNFNLGEKIEGANQLKPRLVPGGTALIPQPYVLKQSFFA